MGLEVNVLLPPQAEMSNRPFFCNTADVLHITNEINDQKNYRVIAWLAG